MLCCSAVSFHPDLGAHIGAIDELLASIAQVGHELIDGFDLVNFLAGGVMIPIGLWPLARIQHATFLRISTEPSAGLAN